MMKAIKLCPEIIFGDTNDIELINPEISLTDRQQRLKVENKCFVGFAGLKEISIDFRNLTGITSHLVIIFVFKV